jgi:nucleolar MIF4G domain-containing protein 1
LAARCIPPGFAGAAKYIPPGARHRGNGGAGGGGGEDLQIRRRVTGLVNRLSDENLPQVASDIIEILMTQSRRDVMDTVTYLLLQVRPLETSLHMSL